MSTMACCLIQFCVEKTTIWKAIAITGQTFVCFSWCSRSPWTIHIKWCALLTIDAGGVVLAITNQLLLFALPSWFYTLIGVSIAFASTTNGKVRNSIVIRAKHSIISKDFITKCVHSNKWNSNLFSGYPILYFYINKSKFKFHQSLCKPAKLRSLQNFLQMDDLPE